MKIDLEGKIIVITGSSRGLGSVMAYKLGRLGATIVINYKSSESEAYKLSNYLRSNGIKNLAIQADVTYEKQVKSMCKEVINRFGKIDVLINNAGICQDQISLFMKYEQWKNVVDTNLNSIFLCSKHFGKEMVKKKYGKIINIASLKGQLGSRGQCNYSASKGGVISITKTLAKELSKFNISVNAVCPGFIVTDLNRNNIDKLTIAKEQSYLDINNNLDDLVSFIALFCSDYIKSVTGQVFNIDSRLA